MTHDELSNFTHEELGNFTFAELELGIPELLTKVKKENRPISISAFEKLDSLCKELNVEEQALLQKPDNLPAVNTKMSAKDAVQIIVFIITILSTLPELFEKYSPIIREIIKLITD